MLEIYVSGTANSGKSTISALIKKVLADYNIHATVRPALPGELAADHDALADLDKKMEAIASGIEMRGESVEILECQMTRGSAAIGVPQ